MRYQELILVESENIITPGVIGWINIKTKEFLGWKRGDREPDSHIEFAIKHSDFFKFPEHFKEIVEYDALRRGDGNLEILKFMFKNNWIRIIHKAYDDVETNIQADTLEQVARAARIINAVDQLDFLYFEATADDIEDDLEGRSLRTFLKTGKLVDYIHEAVDVSTDTKELWELLSPHLTDWRELTDSDMPFIEQSSIICEDLNDLLEDRNITFNPSMESSPGSVASGDVTTDSGYITINVDSNALVYGEDSLSENPTLWLKLLIKTITHELVHREQILRSNVHLGGAEYNPDDPGSEYKYLSNKHEIQAWAKDAVDQLLSYPTVNSSADIKAILRKDGGVFDSEAIGRYHENFVEYSDSTPEDRKIWNRFMKYVYYYTDRIEQ